MAEVLSPLFCFHKKMMFVIKKQSVWYHFVYSEAPVTETVLPRLWFVHKKDSDLYTHMIRYRVYL